MVPAEPRILLVLVAATKPFTLEAVAELFSRLDAVAGFGHAEGAQGRAVARHGTGTDVLLPVDPLFVRWADAEVLCAADTGLARHLEVGK